LVAWVLYCFHPEIMLTGPWLGPERQLSSPLDSCARELTKGVQFAGSGGELVSTEDGLRLVRAVVGHEAT
jgi:hypothetical protein